MMLPKIFQGNLMSDLFDDSFFSDYQKKPETFNNENRYQGKRWKLSA